MRLGNKVTTLRILIHIYIKALCLFVMQSSIGQRDKEFGTVRDLVRAPGWRGSPDGIRTVEAGYRAMARETVTNCRAKRSLWDDTGSFGLMFCCK